MRYVEHAGATNDNAALRKHYGEELLRELVEMQASTHSHFAPPGESGPLPAYVKSGVDFIRAHADQPLTSRDIARAAGVPGRTLQYGFQRFLGTSPMQVLRDERLDRCRLALLAEADGAGVAETARNWGFAHLGRFAENYRRRFGETPRQTLSRPHGR
jgi:transcriptional regulator GlxA family with amidase domain